MWPAWDREMPERTRLPVSFVHFQVNYLPLLHLKSVPNSSVHKAKEIYARKQKKKNQKTLKTISNNSSAESDVPVPGGRTKSNCLHGHLNEIYFPEVPNWSKNWISGFIIILTKKYLGLSGRRGVLFFFLFFFISVLWFGILAIK